MLRLGRKLTAREAVDLGIFDGLAGDKETLMDLALARVQDLAGKVTPIPDGPVEIAPLAPAQPRGKREEALPAEVQAIIEQAIVDGAAAETFADALEVGYAAFGQTACTDAARERIHAFLGSGR
jgi:enoyl-CoA hydratase/3-hydroxyacyl-CoA dehydrogenase